MVLSVGHYSHVVWKGKIKYNFKTTRLFEQENALRLFPTLNNQQQTANYIIFIIFLSKLG